MKRHAKILMLFLLALGLGGCSFSQIINSMALIPQNIRADQLYWDIPEIYSEGCPNLVGTYLIASDDFSRGLGAGVPNFVRGPVGSGRYFDVEMTISSFAGGFDFHGISSVSEASHRLEFDEFFGCSDGRVVWRRRPSVSSGAEVARCDRVVYYEHHWTLDDKGNLVARSTQRSRCWLNRMNPFSKDDVGPYIRVHERIR